MIQVERGNTLSITKFHIIKSQWTIVTGSEAFLFVKTYFDFMLIEPLHTRPEYNWRWYKKVKSLLILYSREGVVNVIELRNHSPYWWLLQTLYGPSYIFLFACHKGTHQLCNQDALRMFRPVNFESWRFFYSMAYVC